MREEFEKLPEIARLIESGDVYWCEYSDKYQGYEYDFDLEKMRVQLQSGVNELPDYKTTEELHQWMKAKRMERLKGILIIE